MSHGKQNTGNWKKNRDRHEKKQSRQAQTNPNWIDQGKHTNSERNKNRNYCWRCLDITGTKKYQDNHGNIFLKLF